MVNAAGSLARIRQPLTDPLIRWSPSGGFVWRLSTWLNSEVSALLAHSPQGPRFIGADEGQLYFADLDPRELSVTLRQEVVLAPTLTLQLYSQLFASTGAYGQAYAAPAGLGRIDRADLTPTADAPDPSFKVADLNLNVVFRWGYRLGSTLYLLYSRSQASPPSNAASLRPTSSAAARPPTRSRSSSATCGTCEALRHAVAPPERARERPGHGLSRVDYGRCLRQAGCGKVQSYTGQPCTHGLAVGRKT